MTGRCALLRLGIVTLSLRLDQMKKKKKLSKNMCFDCKLSKQRIS